MQYLLIVQFCSGKGWDTKGRKVGWLYKIVFFKIFMVKKKTKVFDSCSYDMISLVYPFGSFWRNLFL